MDHIPFSDVDLDISCFHPVDSCSVKVTRLQYLEYRINDLDQKREVNLIITKSKLYCTGKTYACARPNKRAREGDAEAHDTDESASGEIR